MLAPTRISAPSPLFRRPRRVRSLSSKTRREPTNSSISTAQPRGALGLRRHQPGESKLGCVGHRIAIAVGWRSDADHRAHIGGEAVGLRAIMLADWPGIRPGAEEQLQEAMIEDVEKARKRVVAHQVPVVRLLGRRQRQRALRPEQPEEFHEHAEPARGLALELAQIRGREIHVGILAEHDIFVAARRAVTDARPIGVAALQAPHHRVEVEPPRLFADFLGELHSGLRRPMRTGQRMISPRSVVRMIVWVK
jgi:hypothetical protein